MVEDNNPTSWGEEHSVEGVGLPQDLPVDQVHESRHEDGPAGEAPDEPVSPTEAWHEPGQESAEETAESADIPGESPAEQVGESGHSGGEGLSEGPSSEIAEGGEPEADESPDWEGERPQDLPVEEVHESRYDEGAAVRAEDSSPGEPPQPGDEGNAESRPTDEAYPPNRPRRRAATRPAGPPPTAPEAPEAAAEDGLDAAYLEAAPEATSHLAGGIGEASLQAQQAQQGESDASAPGEGPGEQDEKELPASPPAWEEGAGGAEQPVRRSRRATRPVTTVAFSAVPEPREWAGETPAPTAEGPVMAIFQPPDLAAASARRRRRLAPVVISEEPAEVEVAELAEEVEGEPAEPGEGEEGPRRRRRRGGRRRRRGASDEPGDLADEDLEAEGGEAPVGDESEGEEPLDEEAYEAVEGADEEEGDAAGANKSRRRRRRRRAGVSEEMEDLSSDDPPNTVVKVRSTRERVSDDIAVVRGSTRIEAKRQRRRDGREAGRRRPPILTESEFLARREAVKRVMAVRDRGDRTQIAVLEDGVLVEHYVNRTESSSLVGNVYLGKVQNVLPSMEAAFVDIGQGRNAVLYAGEVNWDAAGLEGQPKRIELALKSGDSVLVQVTKDPIGHKGARLTSQISLPGRFLVYVPEGSMTGISRKLPDTERARLKGILKTVVPDGAGVIVRTAAEGASEEQLTADVHRLTAQWGDITKKAKSHSAPALLYSEPDLAIKVVRDIFNEDFTELLVQGENTWSTLTEYLGWVAPDLVGKLRRWTEPTELFAAERVDEQLAKALDRKVWLPSGGSLVIDRTEAMTVVDVNTGKFTGQGGNLEETVTRNNLEAAEEIVRQLRLRDVGGIIVIDFIDMVLESNRDLVLRRLIECLGRDRTRHQVAEVTSLGLVQMTRKRIGQGLLEVFSEPCEACGGRGYIVHTEPLGVNGGSSGGNGGAGGDEPAARRNRNGRSRQLGGRQTGKTPPAPPLDEEGHVAHAAEPAHEASGVAHQA